MIHVKDEIFIQYHHDCKTYAAQYDIAVEYAYALLAPRWGLQDMSWETFDNIRWHAMQNSDWVNDLGVGFIPVDREVSA